MKKDKIRKNMVKKKRIKMKRVKRIVRVVKKKKSKIRTWTRETSSSPV